MNQARGDLSFYEHLDELRERLIKCCISVVICSLVLYMFIDSFMEGLIKPVGQVVFTSPPEAFTARLTLTLLGGLGLSLPIIFYQMWKFVALGLNDQEKKHITVYGPVSLVCFILGGLFAYFIMIPISLQFLLGFSTQYVSPMITISKYISFIGMMMLACGVIFELPIILLFLTKIGIATPEFLRQKRKYAIVLILILSAFLTPPDVITQLLLAVPLIVLYEAGVLTSHFATRKQDR